MKIIFICNGNVLNVNSEFTGLCNDRLSETGVFQSMKLAQTLADFPIDFIFCSDIGYRRTTTDFIINELKKDNFSIYIDQRVREKNAEICSHLLKEYLMQQSNVVDSKDRVILDRLFIKTEADNVQINNNESDQDLMQRASSFIGELLKTYPSDSTILIVGNKIINAFMIKVLLQSMKPAKTFEMDEAAITYCKRRGELFVLDQFNKVDHLIGAL